MNFAIRIAKPEDIAALCALDSRLPEDPHRAEEIDTWVRASQAHVALIAGEPAGYAVLTHSFFREGFMEMLMVGTQFRRQGVGTALVEQLARRCRTQRLWTSTNQSNLAMQSLLTRLGFTRSGIVEGLDEGDPELIWRKVIRPAT
jgi:ribosomal protein S18 acetylase RimI-like enzyme